MLLSVARENDCAYCVAVHSAAALQARAPEQAVEAVRTDRPIEDERLEALRRFTQAVVARRGWVDPDAVDAFLQAGYETPQILEVLAGVTQKTLSNYTNHLGETPLDEAFAAHAWQGERRGSEGRSGEPEHGMCGLWMGPR